MTTRQELLGGLSHYVGRSVYRVSFVDPLGKAHTLTFRATSPQAAEKEIRRASGRGNFPIVVSVVSVDAA
jgi:hypothetical protein